jgi:acetoin utilization protein AcuB
MARSIPQVRKYMTASPHAVGDDQTLATAHKLMREHRIRHLPVLHAGKLKGVVTQRDLAIVETLKDVDPEKVTVDDAMSTDVFTAEPNEPLDEVVSSMAEHKYGSCVVMEKGKVVGIFTTIDACRALTDLLRARLH